MCNLILAIISKEQTCSVFGRYILSALAFTRHSFFYPSKLSINGMFLSLDQCKAFDLIVHACIFLALDNFGFLDAFVQLLT